MTVWDVVCGMRDDDKQWTSKAEYEGRFYYFCCDGCKGAFEKSPEYHLENFRDDHPDVEPSASPERS